MTTFFIYHDGFQSACSAPDIPARFRIELESVDQPDNEVIITSELSKNGQWGRRAKWGPAPITRVNLSLACRDMLEFFRQVHIGLGLIPPRELGFDFEHNSTQVRRISVTSPCEPKDSSPELGDRGWPTTDEYIWKARHHIRGKSQDIDSVPYEKVSDTHQHIEALKLVLIRMLKAKVRLLAGMKLKVSSKWADLDRAIRERSAKRLHRMYPTDIDFNARFEPKVVRIDDTYKLAEFVQTLYLAIGLEPPRSFDFDYEGDPKLASCPAVKRVTLRAPLPISEYATDIDLVKTCWRHEFRAYKFDWCPDTCGLDESPDMLKGTRHAAAKMTRAKFFLTAGMQVPPEIDSAALVRIINDRASKYERRVNSKKRAA